MNTALYAGNSQEPELPKRKNVQDKQTIRREVDALRLAWLAGIIDGEGCILISIAPNRSVQKWVKVENTDVRMVCEISRIYSDLGLQFHFQLIRRINKKANMTLAINVNSWMGIKRLLESILPHLITKRRQAVKMLEFIEYRLSLPMKPGPSEAPLWDDPKMKRFHDELKAMKLPEIDPSTTQRVASQPLEMKI